MTRVYKRKEKRFLRSSGFGLVEVLVGVSIISLTLIGVVFLGGSYEKLSRNARAAIRAEFLLEEGIEGLRSMRDTGWQNIAELVTDAPYAILLENGVYTATTSPQILDGAYTRALTVSPVYRDADFRIVADGGGTIDNDTKHITATISWTEAGTTTVRVLQTYLANLFE
ncbi:MAG: hypothetical protein HYT28_01145 [Parcubacteria group bacterium]|nr:hypothetical protein [Parcubacteria group bacterium]